MPSERVELVQIPVKRAHLAGDLVVPMESAGVVVFAHGSGSSRHSPRNQAVAKAFHVHKLATLLVDLLTAEEERIDRVTAALRFDIGLLGTRLVTVVDWAAARQDLQPLPIGLFGASTGAAAALVAAAARPEAVRAVVSRGGRPDLAGSALAEVTAPTLLLVGSRDSAVLDLNRSAKARMRCQSVLTIIPGASHLFEEPGTLADVAARAAAWFNVHLTAHAKQAASR